MAAVVVYGFAAEHAGAVASGSKTRTIRAVGKRRHAAPGDTVRLYTGQRTKACRMLREAVCFRARLVRLGLAGGVLVSAAVAGRPVQDLPRFARADGFAGPAEMGRFFGRLHGPGEFSGVMIEWRAA